MKNININDKKYEVLEDATNCLNEEELSKYLTEYFDEYDYILGDYSYDKLRLKGFCDENNPIRNEINCLEYKEEYLKNNLSYKERYFFLKKSNK